MSGEQALIDEEPRGLVRRVAFDFERVGRVKDPGPTYFADFLDVEDDDEWARVCEDLFRQVRRHLRSSDVELFGDFDEKTGVGEVSILCGMHSGGRGVIRWATDEEADHPTVDHDRIDAALTRAKNEALGFVYISEERALAWLKAVRVSWLKARSVARELGFVTESGRDMMQMVDQITGTRSRISDEDMEHLDFLCNEAEPIHTSDVQYVREICLSFPASVSNLLHNEDGEFIEWATLEEPPLIVEPVVSP